MIFIALGITIILMLIMYNFELKSKMLYINKIKNSINNQDEKLCINKINQILNDEIPDNKKMELIGKEIADEFKIIISSLTNFKMKTNIDITNQENLVLSYSNYDDIFEKEINMKNVTEIKKGSHNNPLIFMPIIKNDNEYVGYFVWENTNEKNLSLEDMENLKKIQYMINKKIN